MRHPVPPTLRVKIIFFLCCFKFMIPMSVHHRLVPIQTIPSSRQTGQNTNKKTHFYSVLYNSTIRNTDKVMVKYLDTVTCPGLSDSLQSCSEGRSNIDSMLGPKHFVYYSGGYSATCTLSLEIRCSREHGDFDEAMP